MTPFEDILKDIIQLWRWIVAAALVPLVGYLASFSPPWPGNVVPFITAIFELLLIIWAYHNIKGATKKTISKVINFGIPILFNLILV